MMINKRIRSEDRKVWRPGTWITEAGIAVHVEIVNTTSQHADRLTYTLQNTMLVIARAMAAADQTIRNRKQP